MIHREALIWIQVLLMCFHCKMFPIKNNSESTTLINCLSFGRARDFETQGGQIHTYTYSVTRRLLQQHPIHPKLACSTQTWREVKNLMVELGEKAPEIYSTSP